jgi:hypothetical protein
MAAAPERQCQIERLFHDARERPRVERDAWLAHDATLRPEVDVLP